MLAAWQVGLAKSFMLEHLSEPLYVPELARMCRLSPTYFVRAFANTVGMAPYAWFLGQRIAKAEILLAQTGLPLAQIALDCGFSDQAHFTNAFGRATGTTPARWRKERAEPPDKWRQSA
ncbi:MULTISPECIES: AraC family transcriptional regulator [unclassified Novosphingobium]|uniref:helix-turn-helix domain-containing protein n=1 Tax=unclassified Novosphingobium TaxID=2644732 RepID=UPI00146F3677|nr:MULTISPECIES: AraC family transcriptional regulator [unclassified Novosphingobium]NMN06799.1 AraC family transcriptional regulator [Novosphingobium sp. SG919]NMN88750.1 AraC family transcriptional regulator [Novosphingobium sp. SG916]